MTFEHKHWGYRIFPFASLDSSKAAGLLSAAKFEVGGRAYKVQLTFSNQGTTARTFDVKEKSKKTEVYC